MRTFRNRALLDNAIAYLITQGNTVKLTNLTALSVGYYMYERSDKGNGKSA